MNWKDVINSLLSSETLKRITLNQFSPLSLSPSIAEPSISSFVAFLWHRWYCVNEFTHIPIYLQAFLPPAATDSTPRPSAELSWLMDPKTIASWAITSYLKLKTEARKREKEEKERIFILFSNLKPTNRPSPPSPYCSTAVAACYVFSRSLSSFHSLSLFYCRLNKCF